MWSSPPVNEQEVKWIWENGWKRSSFMWPAWSSPFSFRSFHPFGLLAAPRVGMLFRCNIYIQRKIRSGLKAGGIGEKTLALHAMANGPASFRKGFQGLRLFFFLRHRSSGQFLQSSSENPLPRQHLSCRNRHNQRQFAVRVRV